MVGFASLRDGACESCWLTRSFDMMNHSRIIEDMDAEEPTTPPPGSRTTNPCLGPRLPRASASCTRPFWDRSPRRFGAARPLPWTPGEQPRESLRVPQRGDSETPALVAEMPTLGHLLRGAFATSRPSRRVEYLLGTNSWLLEAS
jgi:hypothetical protein